MDIVASTCSFCCHSALRSCLIFILVQLVSTLRVDPEFNLIYFNPNAKVMPLFKEIFYLLTTPQGSRIMNSLYLHQIHIGCTFGFFFFTFNEKMNWSHVLLKASWCAIPLELHFTRLFLLGCNLILEYILSIM